MGIYTGGEMSCTIDWFQDQWLELLLPDVSCSSKKLLESMQLVHLLHAYLYQLPG